MCRQKLLSGDCESLLICRFQIFNDDFSFMHQFDSHSCARKRPLKMRYNSAFPSQHLHKSRLAKYVIYFSRGFSPVVANAWRLELERT